MNPRRLYKSRDRRLAGVAGGMAEYLEIDPTIMRILWVVAGLLSVGFAILAYILLAIVIPDSPWSAAPAGAPMWGQAPQAPNQGWGQATTGWGQPNPAWSQPTGSAQAAGFAQASGYAQGSGSGAAAPSWADPASAWGSPQPSGGWGSPAYAPAPAQGRGIGAAGVIGLVLIALGGIALLNVAIPGWIIPAATGPMILIVLGGAFLVASVRRAPQGPAPMAATGTAPAAPAAFAPAAASAPVDESTSVDLPVVSDPSTTDPS